MITNYEYGGGGTTLRAHLDRNACGAPDQKEGVGSPTGCPLDASLGTDTASQRAELARDLGMASRVVDHQCPSASLAARMSRYACQALEATDPPSHGPLLVYVEMDRCGTAVVAALMGQTPLGLRHLRPAQLSSMSLTLMNPSVDDGVRVQVRRDMIATPALWPMVASDPQIPNHELLTATSVRAGLDTTYEPGRGLRVPECGDRAQRVPGCATERASSLGPEIFRGGWVGDPARAAGDLAAMLLSLGPWPLRHKATAPKSSPGVGPLG